MSDAIGLHPLRTRRSDLDKFLGKLFTTSNGNRVAMGSNWVTGGRDAALICVLANSPRERGTRSGALLFATLTSQPFVQLAVRPTGSGIAEAVTPSTPPNEDGVMPLRRIGTLVHELTHAFDVGDEYSADGKNVPQSTIDQYKKDKDAWNIVVDDEVRDAGHIRAAKIRWAKWPRIAAAGVVKKDPVIPTGPPPIGLTIDLVAGQGAVFTKALADGKISVGGMLRFRRRPLVQDDTSVATTPKPELVVLGPPMVLQSIAGDQVTMTVQADALSWVQNAIDDEEFSDGNVILLASRQKGGVEQYLIHPDVADLIENNGANGWSAQSRGGC